MPINVCLQTANFIHVDIAEFKEAYSFTQPLWGACCVLCWGCETRKATVFSFFLFLFCGARDRAQRLPHGSQVLHHQTGPSASGVPLLVILTALPEAKSTHPGLGKPRKPLGHGGRSTESASWRNCDSGAVIQRLRQS